MPDLERVGPGQQPGARLHAHRQPVHAALRADLARPYEHRISHRARRAPSRQRGSVVGRARAREPAERRIQDMAAVPPADATARRRRGGQLDRRLLRHRPPRHHRRFSRHRGLSAAARRRLRPRAREQRRPVGRCAVLQPRPAGRPAVRRRASDAPAGRGRRRRHRPQLPDRTDTDAAHAGPRARLLAADLSSVSWASQRRRRRDRRRRLARGAAALRLPRDRPNRGRRSAPCSM